MFVTLRGDYEDYKSPKTWRRAVWYKRCCFGRILFTIFFYPENGRSSFLRNVYTFHHTRGREIPEGLIIFDDNKSKVPHHVFSSNTCKIFNAELQKSAEF
jgi:hypothetical protein